MVDESKRTELLIDEIAQLSQDRVSILKKINSPKIGWFSIYTPEEVIHSAGLIPFRITGETQAAPTKARAALFSSLCPYTLSCLEEGMQGIYDFIAGVVTVTTCDARRRLYDAWRHYVSNGVNKEFVYLIDLPRTISPNSKEYFRKQIILFIESLQSHFACKITQDSLSKAITLWNETRILLANLYEFRKQDIPPITGSQAINIVKAAMSGLREEFNRKLSSLVIQLTSQKTIQKPKRTRVLFCGSYFDQTALIELIERSGAIVVCEDLSNGVKYFEGSVSIKEEPITALANYYLEKATCARMADSEMRFQHLFRLVKDYKIEVVIYFCLKFCDPNLIDFPYQKKRLDEHSIPVLFLEGERFLSNLEQLKTRVQAFLERQTLYDRKEM